MTATKGLENTRVRYAALMLSLQYVSTTQLDLTRIAFVILTRILTRLPRHITPYKSAPQSQKLSGSCLEAPPSNNSSASSAATLTINVSGDNCVFNTDGLHAWTSRNMPVTTAASNGGDDQHKQDVIRNLAVNVTGSHCIIGNTNTIKRVMQHRLALHGRKNAGGERRRKRVHSEMEEANPVRRGEGENEGNNSSRSGGNVNVNTVARPRSEKRARMDQ